MKIDFTSNFHIFKDEIKVWSTPVFDFCIEKVNTWRPQPRDNLQILYLQIQFYSHDNFTTLSFAKYGSFTAMGCILPETFIGNEWGYLVRKEERKLQTMNSYNKKFNPFP